MQTILGSGSIVANELAKVLKNYTNDIRLVSRNPKKVNDSDELMPVDVSDPHMLDEAVKGSEIIYVTIGFQYKTSVWKEKWPVFMKSLVHFCRRYNAKIVFLDNIYMYDGNYLSHMTEETSINPSCEKGEIRKKVAGILMDAVEKGETDGLIARAADFYGPGMASSVLVQTVYNNLLKDKSPQWIGKLDVLHSFIYSKDIANGLAILGNTPDAFNQVWHLPTTERKLTTREWIGLFMKEMKKEKKISVLSKPALTMLGIFIPVLREIKEVYYQFDRDYFFDSSKFCNRFNYLPVSPEEGVKSIVRK